MSGLQVTLNSTALYWQILSFCPNKNTDHEDKELGKKQRAKLRERKGSEPLQRKMKVLYHEIWGVGGGAQGDEQGENGEKPSVFSAGPAVG